MDPDTRLFLGVAIAVCALCAVAAGLFLLATALLWWRVKRLCDRAEKAAKSAAIHEAGTLQDVTACRTYANQAKAAAPPLPPYLQS